MTPKTESLARSVFLELLLIEREAKPGAFGQRDAARRDVEALRHDRVLYLQRSDAFETRQHVARRSCEHDLGHRARIEPEAVADHDRDARGLRGRKHARG